MTNFFTPDEFQEIKNEKTSLLSVKQKQYMPSTYSMKVILGYSAALKVIKTKEIGEFEILIN
mgnify:CR=1 FL=1